MNATRAPPAGRGPRRAPPPRGGRRPGRPTAKSPPARSSTSPPRRAQPRRRRRLRRRRRRRHRGVHQSGWPDPARTQRASLGRTWSFTSRFTARGHSPEVRLTGSARTSWRAQAGEIRDRTDGVSFLSAVWVRPRSLALYRHQLADFRAAIDSRAPSSAGAGTPIDWRRRARAWDWRSRASAWPRASARRTLFARPRPGAHRFRAHSRPAATPAPSASSDPLTDSLTGGFYGPDYRDATL
jgi:hypothetical protein